MPRSLWCVVFPVLLSATTAFSSPTIPLQAMKRILVTGGNKGIGKAICERLLSEWQDTHVILGARNKERGQKAIADILKSIGSKEENRLELLLLDTASDESVLRAAKGFETSGGGTLYGIINNAGIGWDHSLKATVATNYFGPRRVNEAFGKYLQRPGGRIVNVSSAAGPDYVSRLPESSKEKCLLGKPWTSRAGIAEVDNMARTMPETDDGYYISKALLNAYTYLHAKVEQNNLIINACTPGYIKTDMTKGMSATNTPSQGAVPPCYLMMDEDVVPKQPTGRYYGSDCVRSPIAFYRGPGEAPYESDEDLVELPPSALAVPSLLS